MVSVPADGLVVEVIGALLVVESIIEVLEAVKPPAR